MELPQNLELDVKLESTNEFNNPSPDFGDRLRVMIFESTQQSLPQDIVDELNFWEDIWVDPVYSWREFIHWVWRKIVDWWNSLWEDDED